MNRPVIVRPEAKQDVQEIRDYLKQQREGATVKFDSRLVAVLTGIAAMPFLHGKVWRKVRAVRVGGFRYVVYYVVFRDRIDVIAVMHGARRAAAWMSRA